MMFLIAKKTLCKAYEYCNNPNHIHRHTYTYLHTNYFHPQIITKSITFVVEQTRVLLYAKNSEKTINGYVNARHS